MDTLVNLFMSSFFLLFIGATLVHCFYELKGGDKE